MQSTQKRRAAGAEMKNVSLSKLVYLFYKMCAEKKKGKPEAAHSSHSLQALSPWRQHKDILFCFASSPILSKGMMRKKKKKKKTKLKSTNEVNEILKCSEPHE